MNRDLTARVVLLVICAGPYALADPDPSAHLDTDQIPPVALNQAVSVESEPATHVPDAGSVEPTTLDGAESNPVTSRRSQVFRRNRSRTDDRSTSPGRNAGARVIPWYRTGYGALALVLGVVAAAAWAAKRWLPAARTGDLGAVRVVGRTNLSPKHTAALVQCGRRFVLVGLSGDRMTTLAEVTDPEEVADMTARTAEGQGSRRVFADLLGRAGSEYEATAHASDESPLRDQGREDRGGARRSPVKNLLHRIRELQLK